MRYMKRIYIYTMIITKYRGQADKEFVEQTILLIFIIKRHNFLKTTGSLEDIISQNFLVFGAEQYSLPKKSLRNLHNEYLQTVRKKSAEN